MRLRQSICHPPKPRVAGAPGGSKRGAPPASGTASAAGAVASAPELRRISAWMRASSSRGSNGLAT